VDGREVHITQDVGIVGNKSPFRFNRGGEDTVPGIGQGGVLITVETMESRASGLEHKEVLEAGLDGDLVTSTFLDHRASLDFRTITDKGVGMGFAVHVQTRPLVLDDVNVGVGDVGVLLQDVFSDFLSKEFNVVDVLGTLGDHVDSVLAGI
jgi:hypothetical protein